MDWINTDEELPEDGIWVLMCGEHGGTAMGYFDEEWICLTPLTPKGKIKYFSYIELPDEFK